MGQLTNDGLLALRDEVENDPTGRGYKEANGTWKSNPVIRRLVNEELAETPVQGPVPLAVIRDLFAPKGILAKMLDSTNDTIRSYGEMMVSGSEAALPASIADDLLQKALDLGLITQAEKDAAMAEGQTTPTRSRAEVAIGPGAEPNNADVETARSL